MILLTAVCAPFLFVSAVAKSTEPMVPSFRLDQLSDHSAEVSHALASNGILAIEMPDGYMESRLDALSGMCSCWNHLGNSATSAKGASTSLLKHGSRTTVATATVGNQPLPLTSDISSVCGSDTSEALEKLRDWVASASEAFIATWDDTIATTTLKAQQPLLRTKYHVEYRSVREITKAATNLEHFHLYSTDDPNQDDIGTETLSLHTDAGLFLSFVPALDCSGTGDAAFWMQDQTNGGKLEQIEFSENSVVIMMGAGGEHWLNSNHPVRATKHAVRMDVGTSRAWYGMMHLVPSTAIVQNHPVPKTFAEMQQSLVHIHDDSNVANRFDDEEVSIGCGNAPLEASRNEVAPINPTTTKNRRRLGTVDDASTCNNITNFFCWFTCEEVPRFEEVEELVNDGYSLYCLDPSVMSATKNARRATQPCDGPDGTPGAIHNSNCIGSWQKTVDGLSSTELIYNVTKLPEEPYCYGGTSMYMDGFQWKSATCVLFLFPNWILNSDGKLFAACIGTILMGILVEFIIFQRKQILGSMSDIEGPRRLMVSASIYAIQLTVGYIVMLVIMIYSGPLFIATIVGLVAGHILFNAKDAIFAKSSKKVIGRAKTNSHLSESNDAPPKTTASCSSGTESAAAVEEAPNKTSCCSKENDAEVTYEASPDEHNEEGITPCCQHTM